MWHIWTHCLVACELPTDQKKHMTTVQLLEEKPPNEKPQIKNNIDNNSIYYMEQPDFYYVKNIVI